MSDLELLFLVIAVLYAWECACWLPTSALGFVTWLGRRWRTLRPGALAGNQRGGFIFVPPFPPLGTILVARPIPFLLAADGLMLDPKIVVRSERNAPVRWNEIKTLDVSGKKIRINGSKFFTATSPATAIQLADRLRTLQKIAAEQRSRAIQDWFKETLDIKAITKRWEQFESLSAPLKLLANSVFLYIFLFAPLMIWRTGFRNAWVGLLVGLLALTVSTAVAFRRIHQTFYPEAGDDRFTHVLITALSPATTIRARDALSRPLLESFHPIAIAKVFCPEQDFVALARRIVLDLRHPAPRLVSGDNGSAGAIARESAGAWVAAVERFLRAHGIDERDLTRPPQLHDATSRSYCPRCEAQFTTVSGVCEDCGGVALRAFAASESSPSSAGHQKSGAPARSLPQK